MTSEATHTFRRLASDDIALVEAWLAERHVAKWFRDHGEVVADARADIGGAGGHPMLMLLAGVPVGFVAARPLTGAGPSACRVETYGTMALTFFIGVTAALGAGHGARFVGQLAAGLLEAGCPRVIASPDARNISAIGCLGRANFKPAGMVDLPRGRGLKMARTE